jgi:hypothetical protein
MTLAVCKRLLHFEAGPEDHTFYACEEHRRHLGPPADVTCFFGTAAHLVEELNEDEKADGTECDFCREGGE